MIKELILREISNYAFDVKKGIIFKTSNWNEIFTNKILISKEIEKNKRFVLVHKLTFDDEILLAFQNGISEKDSVIITEKFISIAVSTSSDEAQKILWEDLQNIKMVNHSVIFLYKNRNQEVVDIEHLFGKNKEKSTELTALFQRILQITSEDRSSLTYKIKNVLNTIFIIVLILGFLAYFIFWYEAPEKGVNILAPLRWIRKIF
ncbi:hypothetical protein [Capnocytophaga canimorsus]|uniref:hypothetical protein n=1 Tax=Capnocytophaga canimorsus TaxID=28188 RepID=UPI0037D35828